jgi:GNAT superfamily N-acetyltransferase
LLQKRRCGSRSSGRVGSPRYCSDTEARAPPAFALFFHNYSTFLGKPGIYLEDLYVKPEFRGAGIGKALLVYLAKLARERGCGRLEWSVLDWNEPAIGFYRGIGASPVGGWTVYRLSGEALEELARR